MVFSPRSHSALNSLPSTPLSLPILSSRPPALTSSASATPPSTSSLAGMPEPRRARCLGNALLSLASSSATDQLHLPLRFTVGVPTFPMSQLLQPIAAPTSAAGLPGRILRRQMADCGHLRPETLLHSSPVRFIVSREVITLKKQQDQIYQNFANLNHFPKQRAVCAILKDFFQATGYHRSLMFIMSYYVITPKEQQDQIYQNNANLKHFPK